MRNGAHYTPHEARAALQYLDPGMPEDSWWRVAAASAKAGISEDEFVSWSRQGANFTSEADTRAKFRAKKRSNGITEGTLYGMARNAGWPGRRGSESPRARQALTVRHQAPAGPAKAPRPGMGHATINAHRSRCRSPQVDARTVGAQAPHLP